MQQQFKHFLITGANGFIGKKLSIYLKSLNYKITAIIKNSPGNNQDNLSKNHLDNNYSNNLDHLDKNSLDNSPCDNQNNLKKNHNLYDQIITHDFNQANNLAAIQSKLQNLPDQNFDAIIHLANIAHTHNNISFTDYWQTNVLSTLDLLDLALITKAKSMVYLSSIKAVQEPTTNTLLNENFQDWPNYNDFYGTTKRMAEELLLQKIQNPIYKNINLSILRPSLVYGPEVKGYLNLLIKAAKKYSLPNLTNTNNTRSMIHIDDLITAILLASQNNAANGKIFILSDNTPYSTKQIFDHIKQQTATQHSYLFNLLAKIPIPYFPLIMLAKLVDVLQIFLPKKLANKLFFNSIILNKLFGSSYFSSSKIQTCLNWQPTHTFFDSKF
jgi:nucleoside-diphosphate-sugar epimerase